MTEALPLPDYKPLLHRMAVAFHLPLSTPKNSQQPLPTAEADAAGCHLHANLPSTAIPWNPQSSHPCPVHGGFRTQQSMAFVDGENRFKTSVLATTHHLHYEADFIEEVGDRKNLVRENGDQISWRETPPENENENENEEEEEEEEEEIKKACEKLCERMQWKSEKQYQEVPRSSFREIGQCQAAPHALHDESRRRDFRGTGTTTTTDEAEVHGTNHLRGRHDRSRSGGSDQGGDRHLSSGESQSFFSDATLARTFRECKERPVSAPIQEPRILSSPRRGSRLARDEHLHRFSEISRPHALIGANAAYNPVPPLHSSPSLRNERVRSKSVEQKRPRFCTGLNLKKGEIITDFAAAAAPPPPSASVVVPKKMLNVFPVVMLHRDATKGVWNRKTNQMELDDDHHHHGHRECCSQLWVSVLENNNNEKVFRAEGRKAAITSARVSVSPIPKTKVAAMATQKRKVPGARCGSLVARSLDLASSSPFSNLKTIVHEMSRPQSACLPKRGHCTVSTPRSCNLSNPELNSSAWLRAKMEALRNETLTEPKALQIAKEHGIVLDKEDEATLKKFLLSDQSPRHGRRALDAAELEGHKTREKYFNLSNIKMAESAAASRELLKEPLSPKARTGCCKNSRMLQAI